MGVSKIRVMRGRFYKSELTVADSAGGGKSFLGILLSMIVLLIISSMIVAAIVIINPEITNFSARKHTTREAITLDEAILGELSPRDCDIHWLPASDQGEPDDQLLFEENKNIRLATMPPSERRQPNHLNGSSQSPVIGDSSTATSHSANLQQYFHLNATTLVSNTSLLSSIEYQGYKLSPSKRYLLIWTSKRKQFRRSFTAKYFLYDIKLDLISSLSTGLRSHKSQYHATLADVGGNSSSKSGNGASDQVKHNQYEQLDSASLYLNDQADSHDELARFQLVEWYSHEPVPGSGQSRDSLILIQNNDIYILTDVADLSSSSTPDTTGKLKRLTFTGKPSELFNGIPDWLYEEEILADLSAIQLSPSGSRLAYMSFDDSLVESMPFTLYGDAVIPRIQRIKYPKAGRPNPTVHVHLVDHLNDDERRADIKLELPEVLARQQHYINRMTWLTNSKLALIWTNRSQNAAQIVICSLIGNAADWSCESNLRLQANGGWLDIADDLYPLDDEHYLALLPKFEGDDVGNFKHIAKVSLAQANTFSFVTSGRKDVLSINGVDSKRSLVYYTSTVVDEPGQRQLFVSELNAASKMATTKTAAAASDREAGTSVCVTCDHYPTECLYNQARVSPSTNYYILRCDGPGIPRVELRATRRRRHRLAAPRLKQQKQSKVLLSHQQLSPRAVELHDTSIEQRSVETRPHNNRLQLADDNEDEGYQSDTADLLFYDGGAPSNTTSGSENLLWVVEDNKELRRRLETTKAMPLTMRLRVPLSSSNYSANVVLLLPPLVSSSTYFKSPVQVSNLNLQQQHSQHRPRRGALASGIYSSHSSSPNANEPSQQQQPLHTHYTLETIKNYADQLAAGLQFPMVVDVYAGPSSQKVDYQFNVNFGHYLASSRRTIYAMIDGRGSAYQGTKRLHEIYKKFGTVEIQDQIDVAAHLAKSLHFIDPTKMAIWGWSYGGYAAAMALAQSNAKALQVFQAQLRGSPPPVAASKSSIQLSESKKSSSSSGGGPSGDHIAAGRTTMTTNVDNNRLASPTAQFVLANAPQFRGVFECAASVAPVTNWIYYDTAYTEKYMSSPWLNERYDLRTAGDHLQPLPDDVEQASPRHRGVTEDQQQQQLPVGANKWVPLNATSMDYVASTNTISSSSLLKLDAGVTRVASQLDLNERYRRASLLDQIANIDRKRFLLIHGTADDNVHFQQSIMLMKRLIQKNVLFETRLYPDQDHSIGNKADKIHLASTLSNFFAECFDMVH